jgi:hypothetical protein
LSAIATFAGNVQGVVVQISTESGRSTSSMPARRSRSERCAPSAGKRT